MNTAGTSAGRTTDGKPGGRRQPLIERGDGFRSGIRRIPTHLSIASTGTALVAAIFGCTGPALVVINGAAEHNLSATETTSWIFAIYVFGGLISVVMATFYLKPIVGAYSIPGAVLVVDALGSYSFSELAGAYIVTSLLVLALGVTGAARRVMTWLPLPIIMAMIAGALMNFAIGVVESGQAAPLIVGTAVVGYLVSARFFTRIPGVVGAVVVGGTIAALTGAVGGADVDLALAAPSLVVPNFDVGAILAVAVPLTVLIIGAENAQAIGVLITERYRPPINSMTIISGIGGLFASAFGGHSANIAGPMTAICSAPDAGPHEGRYTAAILNGLLFITFGAVSAIAVSAVTTLPAELIASVAGLAMISVLLTALKGAFTSGQFQIGAFFALVIAMSGVTLFGVSSPFWALAGGVLASLVLETRQFRNRAREGETEEPRESASTADQP